MQAIFFDGRLSVRDDYPEPRARKGEALIRVILAGICSTDLEIVKGYMDFRGVPGHEFVGMVEECATSGLVGRRVVGEINIGCGRCMYCERGMKNHCPYRSVLGILKKDGAFAEYLSLPEENLHVVDESITDEEAVFTEPLASAFEITEQVNISPDDRVCVLGDGRLGLVVSQVLALRGCRLTVVGKHPEKLSILKRRDINTVCIHDLNEGDFDCVVDATGSPDGIGMAIGLVRARGKVVVKTTIREKRWFDVNRVVVDEIEVIGSRCGPFEPALNALRKGLVDVRSMVTDEFPLKRGDEAFHRAGRGDALKVLLRMD